MSDQILYQFLYWSTHSVSVEIAEYSLIRYKQRKLIYAMVYTKNILMKILTILLPPVLNSIANIVTKSRLTHLGIKYG